MIKYVPILRAEQNKTPQFSERSFPCPLIDGRGDRERDPTGQSRLGLASQSRDDIREEIEE